MNSFTFYSDPGHGWLEVSESDLASVGLNRTDFSAYSYRNGELLYLEEDRDASLFLKAFSDKYGAPVVAENYTDGDSPIRSMPGLAN